MRVAALLPVVCRGMAATACVNGHKAHSPPPKVSPTDVAKRVAAYHAADEFICDGQVLGVGTGSTAQFLIDRVAEKVGAGELKDVVCVPSSFMSRSLLLERHLHVSDLDRHPQLDICIDGADEVDPQLNSIKGGGGCLTQEKIVQQSAKRFILIADENKCSAYLGEHWKYVPVEVLPVAQTPVKLWIQKELGGICKLRKGSGKAGPVVTDNGNWILDWEFPTVRNRTKDDWHSLHSSLKLLPGVVETGLFIGVAEKAVFGKPDGTVRVV